MQHKWFALIFLLSSFPMHAMELTITNYSGDIGIIDDVFVTAICPPLDRPARDALRCYM
jgi:hypothetical protein